MWMPGCVLRPVVSGVEPGRCSVLLCECVRSDLQTNHKSFAASRVHHHQTNAFECDRWSLGVSFEEDVSVLVAWDVQRLSGLLIHAAGCRRVAIDFVDTGLWAIGYRVDKEVCVDGGGGLLFDGDKRSALDHGHAVYRIEGALQSIQVWIARWIR
jgi:hypothetical protein